MEQLPFTFLQRQFKVKLRGGPGQDELLDFIGMDVEESGGDVTAVGVDDFAGLRRYFLRNRVDAVPVQGQDFAVKNAVGQDDPPVFDCNHKGSSLQQGMDQLLGICVLGIF